MIAEDRQRTIPGVVLREPLRAPILTLYRGAGKLKR